MLTFNLNDLIRFFVYNKKYYQYSAKRYFTFLKDQQIKKGFFKEFRGFSKFDSCIYYFQISNIIKIFISIKYYSDEVSWVQRIALHCWCCLVHALRLWKQISCLDKKCSVFAVFYVLTCSRKWLKAKRNLLINLNQNGSKVLYILFPTSFIKAKSFSRKIAWESLFLIAESSVFYSLPGNGKNELPKISVLQPKVLKQPG